MVHLGAVRRVVVHHHQHRKLKPNECLELTSSHESPTVPQAGHGEPIRTRDRGSDGGGQTQSDGLERLGEHEPGGIRNRQVHGWPSHEVPRVHGDEALGRKDGVECFGDRTGIDAGTGGPVVVVDVPPPTGRDGHGVVLAPGALLRVAAPVQLRRQGLGRQARVGNYCQVRRAMCVDRVSIHVDLGHPSVRPDQLSVSGGPHVQRRSHRQHDVGLS